jgi:hypothetical protein
MHISRQRTMKERDYLGELGIDCSIYYILFMVNLTTISVTQNTQR